MTDNIELKPCPFCGEVLYGLTDGDGQIWRHSISLCILANRFVDGADDAADWNQRATPWRLIDENTPRDGTQILATGTDDLGRHHSGVVWWYKGSDTKHPRWLGGHFNSHLIPTHWQPIIPPEAT